MSSTSREENSIAVSRQETDSVPSRSFSDAEILEFMSRHTTLHKQLEVLYVVNGYEATVTYNDSPIMEAAWGQTYRESVMALMLSEQDWSEKAV